MFFQKIVVHSNHMVLLFASYENVKMNQGEGKGGMATKVLTSFTVDICSCDYNMYSL
jgi:hypothetical protein